LPGLGAARENAAMVDSAELKADGARDDARSAACAGVDVHEVPEQDWALWRDLRIDALTEAPYAFGESLEAAKARDEAGWRAWWNPDDPTTGPRYLATSDGVALGMCSIVFPPDLGSEPLIISMWTTPAARGRGVGRALVEACIDYCARTGRARLLLGVVEDNLPARRLYDRLGFTLTGDCEPLASDPSSTLLWMAREIAPTA
jgi:GNAT superfamily N-acetyltransferase